MNFKNGIFKTRGFKPCVSYTGFAVVLQAAADVTLRYFYPHP